MEGKQKQLPPGTSPENLWAGARRQLFLFAFHSYATGLCSWWRQPPRAQWKSII